MEFDFLTSRRTVVDHFATGARLVSRLEAVRAGIWFGIIASLLNCLTSIRVLDKHAWSVMVTGSADILTHFSYSSSSVFVVSIPEITSESVGPLPTGDSRSFAMAFLSPNLGYRGARGRSDPKLLRNQRF